MRVRPVCARQHAQQAAATARARRATRAIHHAQAQLQQHASIPLFGPLLSAPLQGLQCGHQEATPRVIAPLHAEFTGLSSNARSEGHRSVSAELAVHFLMAGRFLDIEREARDRLRAGQSYSTVRWAFAKEEPRTRSGWPVRSKPGARRTVQVFHDPQLGAGTRSCTQRPRIAHHASTLLHNDDRTTRNSSDTSRRRARDQKPNRKPFSVTRSPPDQPASFARLPKRPDCITVEKV
jgi:hypothetical protein